MKQDEPLSWRMVRSSSKEGYRTALTLKAEERAGVSCGQPLRVEEVVLRHRVVQSGRRCGRRRRRGHRSRLCRGFGLRRGRVAQGASLRRVPQSRRRRSVAWLSNEMKTLCNFSKIQWKICTLESIFTLKFVLGVGLITVGG